MLAPLGVLMHVQTYTHTVIRHVHTYTHTRETQEAHLTVSQTRPVKRTAM